MAVGTTSDRVIKRDELIKDALWHVRALPPDGRVSTELLRRTVRILNNILRQEDLKLTGDNRALWALDYAALFIVPDSQLYAVAQGLRADAHDVVRIQFRDIGGADSDVAMIPQHSWDGLDNKNEIGETTKVYIQQGRLPKDNVWFLWPVVNSSTATAEVLEGATNFQCVQTHTSDADTRPGIGQSFRQYWQQGGTSATAQWATATAYVNGELLYYSFKRPLFDFVDAFSNPDMPQGWEGYLTYKLALAMAAGRDLAAKDISVISGLMRQAEIDIFPSRQPKSDDFHNKVAYF